MMYSKKYRPFKFSDVVGQKGIVSELKERSKNLDFAQISMYAGKSGSGKTSVALILAALINDSDLIVNPDGTRDPNPESLSSKAIINESFNRDVSFYDASAMGKEDIIKLESLLNASPMYDRARVVIIDEAQELSKSGKGATLRLLEKKRKNVYLILCTMNKYAFDPAVRSRCVLYDFKKVNPSDIATCLYNIVKQENLIQEIPKEFITKGLFTIAENCDGSVRVGIQCLERAIKGKFFSEQELMEQVNAFSDEKLEGIIRLLLRKDPKTFKDICETDVREFFYKSEKTLMSSVIYKCSGYVDSPWKARFAKEIMSHKNLSALLDVYSLTRKVLNYYSFPEMTFFHNLVTYFESNGIDNPRDAIKIPVRTVRKKVVET